MKSPGVKRELGTQHLIQSTSPDVFIFLIFCRSQPPVHQYAKKAIDTENNKHDLY